MDYRPQHDEEKPPSLEEKVSFLSSPEAHGGAPVDVRETHMAWVFLAGDRAYKLKKPVRLPFLDYSTLAARARICSEEVRLNRRLAPDVYLGTARLTFDDRGGLAIDGGGRTVEWMVSMRRLPEERMLDRCIRDHSVTRSHVEKVARRLRDFYRDKAARVRVDAGDHVAQFARELKTSCEIFGEFGRTGDRGRAATSALLELLEKGPEIVVERVLSGRIVEGHGDLRPEHVCLEDPPVVIDCLEFSRALRLVDPFDELSFLAMECAVLGAPWIGPMLIEQSAELLGERPSRRQLSFYTAYRATLRARQAVAHLLEASPRTPDKWLPQAKLYLNEAETAVADLSSDALSSRRRHERGEHANDEAHNARNDGSSLRIFALGDSKELGERVAKVAGRPLDSHEERDFEDGEHKARPLTSVRGGDVYVLQLLAGGGGESVNDRLVKLSFFLSTCKEHGAARVTAVVPYLAYARKDRQTKRRDPVTTRYVAALIEAAGADRIMVLDVHNLAAFQNSFRCGSVHLEARSLFVPSIRALAAGLPVTILSPDAGGVKRAELLRRRYEEMTGAAAGFGFMEKHRSAGRVRGDLFAGEVEGSAVFIVDDLVSTGGTLRRAAVACRKRGAAVVFAAVTHGLFGEGSEKMLEEPALDGIVVTDSLPMPARKAETLPADRLRIVAVAPLLGRAVDRLHREGSISDLLGAPDGD